MTRFITVTSGKGGVGKTSSAINLGIAFTNFGYDVVIVDTNLETPHVSLHFGTTNLPHTIHDALHGKLNIRQTAYLHPCGLKIIPADISLKAYERLNSRHYSMIGDLLTDLIGTADIIIMDTASGIGRNVIEIIKHSDEVLIVTNNDMPSLSDAIKIIRKAEQFGKKIGGIVVNRVKDEVSKKAVEALLEHPVIGMIPEDQNMKKAMEIHQPVVYSYPDSPSSIAFKKTAAGLIGQIYEPQLRKKEHYGIIKKTLKQMGLH